MSILTSFEKWLYLHPVYFLPSNDLRALGFSVILGTNGLFSLSILSLNLTWGLWMFLAVNSLYWDKLGDPEFWHKNSIIELYLLKGGGALKRNWVLIRKNSCWTNYHIKSVLTILIFYKEWLNEVNLIQWTQRKAGLESILMTDYCENLHCITFLFQLAVGVVFTFGVAVAMIKFSSFFFSPADSSR